MRMFLVSLLLFGSSIAYGAPQPGQVIWSNIKYGMTKEQVRALYPKNATVDLGNGCSAWIDPGYESKIVVEVKLGGTAGTNFCDENVLASLTSKYGKPRTVDVKVVEPEGANLVGGRLGRIRAGVTEEYDTIRTRTWFTGDTLITLELNETMHNWHALYQPAEIRKPALTDKL